MDILCKLQHAYTSYSVNPLFSLSQKTNIHPNILVEKVKLRNIINHRQRLIEIMYNTTSRRSATADGSGTSTKLFGLTGLFVLTGAAGSFKMSVVITTGDY